MKEKIFEELIEEKYAGSNMMLFSKDTLIKFMQQVREATIAEVEQYIRDHPEIALDFTRGREIKIDIPKDRIKIYE